MGDEGYDWEWNKIGTESEKMGVAREVGELEEKLGKVAEWEQRLKEIDKELNRVLTVKIDGKNVDVPGEVVVQGQEVDVWAVMSFMISRDLNSNQLCWSKLGHMERDGLVHERGHQKLNCGRLNSWETFSAAELRTGIVRGG